MKVALVSLDQIWENKDSNLNLCKEYIEKASKIGVELIIFPEMTLTAFTMDIEINGEVEKNSYTINSFQELAISNKLAVIFGVIIKEELKATNRMYFIDENGLIIDNYKKIHPFSFSSEDKYFIAGEKPKIIEYKGMKIGLSICYDLRFSNLYQFYTLKGTNCIINIANWPLKRIDHWYSLLKARAIENQQFIIGVNRIGKDKNNLEYIESSTVYNANGEISELVEKIDYMKIFNIEKNWTNMYREKFNTIQDIKEIK